MPVRTRIAVTAAAVAAAAVAALLLHAGGREWRPGQPLPRDRVTVGVIHVDDARSGYSYAHDQGVESMREALGLEAGQIVRKLNVNDADPLMVEHMMRECIDAGAAIILATSWGHADVCAKLAPLHPGVVFANASGHQWNDSNFTNYFGRIYQARYLSGIGVERANPDARVYVRVTDSWYDPAGERLATRRLLEAGCDVVAQHCNTPDPQIQAEAAGAWGIGYNSDMARDAPGAVLTSVVWNWGAYYTHLVRSVMDGTFTTTPYYGGLLEGMVGITPLTSGLTDAAMQAAVDAERERMEWGETAVFDGELPTNDGRTVGRAGGVLPDEAIVTGMDWYYRTVVEL